MIFSVGTANQLLYNLIGMAVNTARINIASHPPPKIPATCKH
jgi:hypothetical protein